jgi:hypothetical protein
MPFPCPACQAAIDRSPETWALRCPSCGALLRSRALGEREGARVYEVEARNGPGNPVRVEMPWSEADERRLSKWLFWSSLTTLGLIPLLYVLVRMSR